MITIDKNPIIQVGDLICIKHWESTTKFPVPMSFPFRSDYHPSTYNRLVEFFRPTAERFVDERKGDNVLYAMADAALGRSRSTLLVCISRDARVCRLATAPAHHPHHTRSPVLLSSHRVDSVMNIPLLTLAIASGSLDFCVTLRIAGQYVIKYSSAR